MTAQMEDPKPERAGIVLCGGRSSRMGRPKAELPWGNETLLERVVRRLSQAVNVIVVVAARDQELAKLPDHVEVVHDEQDFEGPLPGIELGLRKLCESHKQIVAAYVTGCDVPNLNPQFVEKLFELCEEYDAVVPRDEHHFHPLSAVYRTRIHDAVSQLVESGGRRPRQLFERMLTLPVDPKSLEHVDQELGSLTNMNTPLDYANALDEAGLAVPDWVRRSIADSHNEHPERT